MNKPWMLIEKIPGTTKYKVRYSTPPLGFAVTKDVPEEIAHILQVALEVGKQEKQDEIKKVLGL